MVSENSGHGLRLQGDLTEDQGNSRLAQFIEALEQATPADQAILLKSFSNVLHRLNRRGHHRPLTELEQRLADECALALDKGDIINKPYPLKICR